MISEIDKKTIKEIAQKYRVKLVLLFGSCLDAKIQSRDIDIAIEGIESADYYKFYGELLFALSMPVDVIDLSHKSKFTDLIRREGVVLYA